MPNDEVTAPLTDDDIFRELISADIAPLVFHQSFIDGELRLGMVSKNNLIRTKEIPAIGVQPEDFSARISFVKDEIAVLSLEDYQSVSVAHNLNQMSFKLISAYAYGNKAQVEEICPGFAEKYGDKIKNNGTNTIAVDDETWQALQGDLRENFSAVFPDFLAETEKKWSELRAESNIDKTIAVNDYVYEAIANQQGNFLLVNEDNTAKLAAYRQANNEILDVLKKEKTSEIIKDDVKKYKQVRRKKVHNTKKANVAESVDISKTSEQNLAYVKRDADTDKAMQYVERNDATAVNRVIFTRIKRSREI